MMLKRWTNYGRILEVNLFEAIKFDFEPASCVLRILSRLPDSFPTIYQAHLHAKARLGILQWMMYIIRPISWTRVLIICTGISCVIGGFIGGVLTLVLGIYMVSATRNDNVVNERENAHRMILQPQQRQQDVLMQGQTTQQQIRNNVHEVTDEEEFTSNLLELRGMGQKYLSGVEQADEETSEIGAGFQQQQNQQQQQQKHEKGFRKRVTFQSEG
eukprot:TRINITY_DN4918_c0_g2_i10.p2 TRINITY_DN4918_c0_g2~~TRINITY_DN4918_c0_g2_i10.p2  ORF type:complete len:215 (+),score=21.60 TRINITY_DN4918_c0_g2_i10:594-1238(+)